MRHRLLVVVSIVCASAALDAQAQTNAPGGGYLLPPKAIVDMRALVGGVKGLLDNSKPLQIHGTYRWGQLANFHMLDTRQYRSVQVGCGVSGLFDPKGCDGLGWYNQRPTADGPGLG